MTVATYHYKDTVVVAPVDPSVLPALSLEVALEAPSNHIYKDAVLADQPAVYLRLEEVAGSVAGDEVGNQSGIYVGGVTLNQPSLILPGDANPSISLDGSTGYVNVSSNPVLDMERELTLEAWVNMDTVTGGREIVRRENHFGMKVINGSPQVYYWSIYVTETESTVGVHIVNLPVSLLPSTTYHLAFTIDETMMAFYVNGEQVWEQGATQNPFAPSTSALQIGRWEGGTDYFDGFIDEVAVYPFALSKERLAYHYAARNATTALTWTVISDDQPGSSRLKEMVCKRGRSDELRDAETGTLTGVLRNQDRRFDPANTVSPYYPNIKPVKQVRLLATISGVTYPLWRGDVQEWPQEWNARENDTVLTCVDAWDFLAQAEIEEISRPVELTGTRINALLDAAGWPRNRRDIDPGLSLVRELVKAQGKAKELIDKASAVEAGAVFVSNTGDIVVRNRMEKIRNPNPIITFSNEPAFGEYPIADARVLETKDTIKNSIQITVTDGPTFRAEDPTSVLAYRKRTYTADLPFADHNEAQAKAEWMLSQYKDPFPFVQEAIIEPQMDTSLWPQVFEREIGDRVRFKIYPPGSPDTVIDMHAIIELIEHKYTVGRWTTKMRFSPVGTDVYWILGTSTLGAETRLAY